MSPDTTTTTKWMTIAESEAHAKCGRRKIYTAINTGRLRAARLGGSGPYRLCAEWIDAWIESSATPVIVVPRRRGAA